MKKLLLPVAAMAAVAILMAAVPFPSGNVPISQLPIATNALENAYFPLIQPLPGRTTNDNFRVAVSNLFRGRFSEQVTNLTVVNNLYASNFFTTNFFTTNTTLVTSNLIVSGLQVIITNGAASGTPTLSTNAFWVDTSTSQSWLWDPTGLSWVAINPAFTSGIYTLPTVADLRLVHDNGYLQWATVWGNLVPGDGQGRRYWWDASNTNSDDGIKVIDLNEHTGGEAGRWDEE